MLKRTTTTCWYCHLHDDSKKSSYSILDKHGCCKRCGTNLKKYPTRESHEYPDISNEKITREVLGTREKFAIFDENDQDNW